MSLEKRFLIVVVIAIILALPVSIALQQRTHLLELEKKQNTNLQLQLNSKEKELEQKIIEVETEKKQKLELEQQLQSKREAQTKLALEVQARKAPVLASGDCAAEISKYDWPVTTATGVMMGESGGNPGRLNDNPSTGDYSVGCFQINIYGANARTRPSEAWLKNATNNVSYAHGMYVAQGRTFCTTGGWYNTCKKLGMF